MPDDSELIEGFYNELVIDVTNGVEEHEEEEYVFDEFEDEESFESDDEE